MRMYWDIDKRIRVIIPGCNSNIWKYKLRYPDGASLNTMNIKRTIKEN